MKNGNTLLHQFIFNIMMYMLFESVDDESK